MGADVGPAQRHGLAVVGVAVMRQPVGVAFAAAFIADGFEIIALRIHDFMRGVTIRADRSTRIALWPAIVRECSGRKFSRRRYGICRRFWRRWRG